MLFAILVAIFSESATFYILNIFKRQTKEKAEMNPINFIKVQYNNKVVLPDSAVVLVVLLGPVFAFAALLPICSAIPYFSFIPIMHNSSDLLQISQFFILSDTLAIVSVYALGTKNSEAVAKNMSIKSLYLILSLLAFFTVVATYTEFYGSVTDVFRLNTFMNFSTVNTLSTVIYVTMFVFAFLILAQLPHENFKTAKYFLNNELLTEYQGAPRLIMSLWSLFRSFIIAALIVVIISPLPNVPATFQPWGISWISQFINFLFFWIALIFTRIFVVSVSWALFDKVESIVPRRLSKFLVPILILILTSLILIGIFILSSDVASF